LKQLGIEESWLDTDERDRNYIEGKFGEAKRRYSLDRVMTKLSNTSETAIAITFLVMNLSALLRRIIMTFFVSILGNTVFFLFLDLDD
jgi:transposase, IS5 family